MSLVVSCDPADVTRLDAELQRDPNNIGVGIIDKQTGVISLATYDETDAFSTANLQLQVMAGHEAGATMFGVALPLARGFVVGKQGTRWLVVNSSHLNQPDGQTNSLQMETSLFHAVVTALEQAGVVQPMIY